MVWLFLFRTMKPTYIQKGSEGSVDILNRWGITVQETPFHIFPEPKEYAKRDWPDRDGDDIFIPSVVRYKSFTQAWKFVYIGAEGSANDNIRGFVSYLQRNEFSIFSEYTMDGVRGVYSKTQSDKFLRRDKDYATFSIDILVHKPRSTGKYIGPTPINLQYDEDVHIYWSTGDMQQINKNTIITSPQGAIFGIVNPQYVETISNI